MKIIILLTAMTPLLASASAICNACFDHSCYTKKKLFEADQISGQIAIDRMDNLLHLHYKDHKNSDHTTILDLNYDEIRTEDLPVHYSFARAVNQNTGEVYFGGNKGIYKYNSVTKDTTHFGQLKSQIWHMQYKGERLYFSEYEERGLFYIEYNKTKCVPPLSTYIIYDFIIDKHDDIYFVSNYLLYRYKKDDDKATLFSTIVYTLTTDIYNNAYFVDINARMMYTLEYKSYLTLVEVGMFEPGTQVFRLVFDKLNRIIYSDAADDKVYLLAPNYALCSLTKKYDKKKSEDELITKNASRRVNAVLKRKKGKSSHFI